jgi:hypothetical protein
MVNVFTSTALTEVLIGDWDVNIAIDQAWEGDDAYAQGDHGKDETDPGAKSDQFPPLLCVEDIADELREGLRRRGSKERHIKRKRRSPATRGQATGWGTSHASVPRRMHVSTNWQGQAPGRGYTSQFPRKGQ